MKIAFLYAGQGSQKVGMGKDIYENNKTFKSVIDSIDVDVDVKKLMFEGPMDELSKTKNTQPCMAAFAAGVTDVLKENGIIPDVVAGLSLGEYSALYCSEVFDVNTFIKLVAYRGKVMEEAAEGIKCKMSAVLGIESHVLGDICNSISTDGHYVTVSNYNCKGQYVICGDESAVEEAEDRAKEAGAKRCIPLKVSGPFHTSFMKPAGEALDFYFDSVNFNDMKIPVLFNTTADFIGENERIRDILVKQVQSSIYMENIIEKLEKFGIDTVIEIGPGKALSGFVKKTAPSITTYNIEDIDGLNNIIERFGE